jgi:hypothetical protein
MYKFYSKSFTDPDKIDKWLNGFYQEGVMYAAQAYDVIGYVVLKDAIIITVRQWQTQKVDLTTLPKRGEK